MNYTALTALVLCATSYDFIICIDKETESRPRVEPPCDLYYVIILCQRKHSEIVYKTNIHLTYYVGIQVTLFNISMKKRLFFTL